MNNYSLKEKKMKLVCDGLDLSEAITQVSKGISTKTTNPILEGIKLTADEDYLILSATDLELSIEKKIRASVKIEGETVVPGRLFAEFVKKLHNEQIELELTEDNVLSIFYTDSCGKIQCLKTDEFPNIKKYDYSDNFEITQKNLKTLISRSVFAVAVNDVRPILKGCLVETNDTSVKFVALDGYRLAVAKSKLVSATTNISMVVPAKSLKEISSFLEDNDEVVKVFVTKSSLMIEMDNVIITSRLLDGDFINYIQIIPTSFTSTVVINKDQLESAIERASLLSRVDKNNLIKFNIKEKVLQLQGRSEIANINEKITISLKGNDLDIGFNVKYFSDALRTINDEFIKLEFTSTIAPCVITHVENDDYLHLILPVRII